MNCEKWKALLAADLYGDNSPEDQRALQTHLEGCADCRAQAQEWRRAAQASRAPDLPKDDAFWLAQKTAVIQQLPPRGARAWHWQRLAGPALAFGLLLSAWGWHQRTEQRTNAAIAQHIGLLQNMDMIQNLDVIEDLDQVPAQ